MEKVSVLVPIYNSEKYIKRCLESIINQTYKNLEILLIEDGSEDNSYNIIKKYQEKDDRIKIYQIVNNGVADARNKAVENSTGEYITFVDSDDYIEKDYIETLYSNLKKYNSDIAVCNCYNIIEETNIKTYKTFGIDKVQEYTNFQAVENLFYYLFLRHSPWGKLYKKEVWNNIIFPIGKNYEDLAILYKLFLNSNKIIYIPEEKYNYVIRKGSIVHNEIRKSDIEAILEYTKAILEDIKKNYPNLTPSAEYLTGYLSLVLWRKIPEGKYKEYLKNVEDNIKKYRWKIIKNKKVNKKQKLLFILSYFGRNIYSFVITLIKG